MKIVLSLALAISVYAADTCYTVQLISKYNSKKNMKLLEKTDYPQSCKLMEIGKSLTVRCGCFEKYVKATESLEDLKKEYKQAVVSSTYAYRFQNVTERAVEREANVISNDVSEKPEKKRASLASAEDSLISANGELEEAKSELSELQKIKTENSEYTDFNALNKDIEITQAKVKGLEAKAATLSKRDMEDLSSNFAELSQKRDTLNQEISDINQEIASIQEELREKKTISSDVSEKIENKRASLASFGYSLISANGELKEVKSELGELEKIKAKNSKYTNFSALNRDIEITQAKVKGLESKVAALDKNKLTSEISKLSSLQSSLNKDVVNLNVKLENKNSAVLVKEKELAAVTDEMKEISGKMKSQKKTTAPEKLKKEDNQAHISAAKRVNVQEPIVVENSVALNESLIVLSEPVKKKKEKKKKRKSKTIKKRDARYVYDPYVNMLSNDIGIGSFDYKYRFGAQISYDLGIVSEVDPLYTVGNTYYTQNDWRRVRVFHKGSFFNEKLFYEMEYSFTGNNKYKDVFVGYTDKINFLNTRYRVKAGNIKIPFSLETYTSSKYITFMERALTDAYAEGRKIGGEVLLSTKLGDNRVNLFAAGFSNSIDEKIDDEVEQPGYSTRATYAYKFSKRHIVSLGGAFMNQDMKGEDVRFNQSSESEFTKDKYVSVKISDVDTLKRSNVEALYINEKFSLQGEYTTVATESLENDYFFDAYYLEGSYFLLGKGKRYKLSTSTLGKIRPNKDGAIELAFRYSYIDLNDKDERGGTQTDYNYALNWYYSPELKFMVNFIVAEPTGTDDYDGRLKILQSRVLFAF